MPSACACTQAFEAVQLKQDYAKGHSRMATALMAMNLYREAQQSYHTALRLEPGNEAVMTQLRAVEEKLAAGALGIPPAPAATSAAGPQATGHAAIAAQLGGGGRRQVAAVPVPMETTGIKRDRPLDGEAGSGKRQATEGANATGAAALPKTRVEELQQAGNAAFRAGEHANAYQFFSQAIETTDTPNANLHANRSAVLCALMRFEEAIKDADTAVRIKPDWGRGHSRRGNALHAMCKRGDDRWNEARLAYQTALKIDPDNAVVRRALQACNDQA